MTYEVSSGAVVFIREGGYLRYVIVRSLEGYYGFPKGHMEGAETEEELHFGKSGRKRGFPFVLSPASAPLTSISFRRNPA